MVISIFFLSVPNAKFCRAAKHYTVLLAHATLAHSYDSCTSLWRFFNSTYHQFIHLGSRKKDVSNKIHPAY